MDPWDFKKYAWKISEYIVNQNRNIDKVNCVPNVSEGFLFKQLKKNVSEKGESFDEIFDQFKNSIAPGLLHWNHPRFSGPYPSTNSYSCVLADVLGAAIGNVGFAWKSCPILTEMEFMMINWVGILLRLPVVFLPKNHKKGGGSMQQTPENAFHNIVFVAREKTQRIETNKKEISSLMVFASRDCGLSVSRICEVENLSLCLVETTPDGNMNIAKLKEAIIKNKSKGFTPLIIVCTIGTFSKFAVDEIEPISTICKNENIWLHADCSYSTGALLLSRYNYMTKGLENADSIVVSLNNWLNIAFDSTILYVKDAYDYSITFGIRRPYLESEVPEPIDLRNHGVALSRRFRSLKIWFEIRLSGRRHLEKNVQHQVYLTEEFITLLNTQSRFEIVSFKFCFVHFRIINYNDKQHKAFYQRILDDRKCVIFLIKIDERYCLRFTVTSLMHNRNDIADFISYLNHVASY